MSNATSEDACTLQGLTNNFNLTPFISTTAIITIIINILTSFTAITSNFLLIYSILSNRHLRKKSSNATICCLALMDAIVGLVAQPFLVTRRFLVLQHHREDCIVVILYNHIATILGGASLSTLAVIGFERYLSIVYPIMHRVHVTSSRMLALVLMMWVAGVFQAMQIYYGGTYISYIYVSCTLIMLCLVSCLMFYVEMYRTVRKSNANIGKAVQEKQKREFKIAKNMAVIMILMIVCYTPSLVSFALGSDLVNRIWWWQNVYPWTDTLAYVNSTINPFMFCWKNTGIRNEVMKIVKCVKWRGNEIQPARKSTIDETGQNPPASFVLKIRDESV